MWRWVFTPHFSLIHVLGSVGVTIVCCGVSGAVCFDTCGDRMARQASQGFLESGRQQDQQISALHLECFPPRSNTSDYAASIELEPFRGYEEPDEARGTNMTVKPDANEWGVPMADSTLVINGKQITFDEILYGYDLMFENLQLFTHTSWFGVSTQQDPSDAFALSSLLWREQPDLVIEIGTNTGGGAIFYATVMREYNPHARVLTIDPKDPSKDWAKASEGKRCKNCVDVRCAPIWHSHVEFLQGFSSEPSVLTLVEERVKQFSRVMVMHDGSHFYKDVIKDLNNYDRFVTVGSYMVVQDTKMTRMYKPLAGDKFPMGAVEDFMSGQGVGRYAIDKQYEFLLYSQHHNGFLRKVNT